MEAQGRLSRLTLDELPLNVAVIAADGEIVDTNRGWRTFGERAGRETGDLGENYFEAAAEDAEAVRGIKAVIAGERDLFEYEYPCHTPERQMWFLMRVTRFESGGDPYAVVAHIEITDRKLAELETEHVLERIDGLVTDLTEGLVAAGTRSEVEEAIIMAVAEAPKYAAAVVGRQDQVTEQIDASAVSGLERAGDWTASGDSTIGRAIRDASVVIVESLEDEDDEWARDAVARGFVSAAAVPIASDGTVYGVLVVFSRLASVFDDRERRILQALGQIAGTAVRAVETARTLTATSVVEIELEVESETLVFLRLAEALGCRLRFRGTVRDDERPLVFFEVSGVEAPEILEWGERDGAVEDVAVIWTEADESLVEFHFREVTPLTRLADHGVETTELRVEDGVARFTLVFPVERETREVLDLLPASWDVDLLSQQHRDRPRRTAREAWTATAVDLTPRQQTALMKAYVGGFFDWPRQVTGDELADSMGITRSTFHQHLRAAEAKVLEAFFEYPN